MDILELSALCLLLIHFSVPLIYFFYLYLRHFRKPWNVKVDHNYKPYVTIVVPTYNEATVIEAKLRDIHHQSYPSDLIEIIVADSSSNDGTPEIAENWCRFYSKIPWKILRNLKKGKIKAILESITFARGDIFIVSDADAMLDSNAVKECVKYFADPKIGVVTASLNYYSSEHKEEKVYRSFYNIIRVGESKLHSTPIHSGVFQAFRKKLLSEISSYAQEWMEDCSLASLTSFMGHRAIQVDDVRAYEPIRGSLWKTKVRRAQHLLLSFLKTKGYTKRMKVYQHTKSFEKIWKLEWWFHVVNPWLLIMCAILLIIGTVHGSFIALTLLGIGVVLLIVEEYRTWVMQQLYLVSAAVRNLWTKEIIWSK